MCDMSLLAFLIGILLIVGIKIKTTLHAICIFSSVVLSSVLINFAVSQEYVSKLLDSVAVDFLSVLVGLAIALQGIIAPIIQSLYDKEINRTEGNTSKKRLDNIVIEIKDNALFVLFSYFAVLLTIFGKGLNNNVVSCAMIDRSALVFGMNVSALVFMMLSGFALYDTIISIMKLLHYNSGT